MADGTWACSGQVDDIAEALDRGFRPAQLELAQGETVGRIRRERRRRILTHHIVVGRPRLGESLDAVERLGFPEAPFEPLGRRRDGLEAAERVERLLVVAQGQPRPVPEEQQADGARASFGYSATKRSSTRRASGWSPSADACSPTSQSRSASSSASADGAERVTSRSDANATAGYSVRA